MFTGLENSFPVHCNLAGENTARLGNYMAYTASYISGLMDHSMLTGQRRQQSFDLRVPPRQVGNLSSNAARRASLNKNLQAC
jgi:hypothetical protein